MSELWADRHIENMVSRAESEMFKAQMALRDQFALAAMQSLLLREDYKSLPVSNVTRAAYIYADEMLKAREAK